MSQTNEACTDIGRSNVQELFIVLEDKPGVIAYPTKDNFIAVANDATANQSPEYTDSPEKLGTRDVIDRFKNAMPAAEAAATMLLRLGATGSKPQGYDALVSLFGTSTLETPPVFTLGAAQAADVTIPIASQNEYAPLPPCGIIQVGSEQIYYDAISANGASLTGCKRGYNGTIAAAITNGTAGQYKSLAFTQADCNPSFTLWLRTDHLVQAVTGATVNTASISLSNEGPLTFDFSNIQGMEMILSGTSKVKTAAAAGSTKVTVENPKSYTAKGWIWNKTVQDNNGGPAKGYKIVSVDDATGVISLSSPLAKAWPVDSVVAGFLPQDAEFVGEPIEGADTDVFLDGVKGKLRSSSLTYNNNIQYLTDEIGTRFPQGYVENARTIDMQMNTYFRAPDGERFKEGYEGKYVSARFAFGRGKAVLHMPRVQQSMPAINMEPPVVSLDITGTVLGSGKGNNAVYLVIN